MRVMNRNVALCFCLLTLAGCKWDLPWTDSATGAKDVHDAGTSTSRLDYGVGPPLGGVPGGLKIEGEPNMPNPQQNDRQAVADGHRLFLAMNCASCHGYDGKGGMGPNLTDKQWRYAGTPAAIFNSISQGRPQGMPSWGRTLPAEQIWNLVGYIESLGGTYHAGQYNASLEGDTDSTQVAPGFDAIEKITASLGSPTASNAAPGASPDSSTKTGSTQ